MSPSIYQIPQLLTNQNHHRDQFGNGHRHSQQRSYDSCSHLGLLNSETSHNLELCSARSGGTEFHATERKTPQLLLSLSCVYKRSFQLFEKQTCPQDCKKKIGNSCIKRTTAPLKSSMFQAAMWQPCLLTGVRVYIYIYLMGFLLKRLPARCYISLWEWINMNIYIYIYMSYIALNHINSPTWTPLKSWESLLRSV